MSLDELKRRESRFFLPVVNRLPLALVEGRGARVRDIDGREYTDLTAGWGVTCIGHCHPALVAAISDQAGRLMQTTNLFYTLPQLDLIERLAALTPPAVTRSFLVSSGTEAMEGALKLAHRATGRTRFVSTANSFHGRTLGALRVIGQAKHRAPYDALLPEANIIPFDDLDAARQAIDTETAAFVVEPVQGEGGVNVPTPGYLTGLREICDATGTLLLLDEIQTCMGRTGRMFALVQGILRIWRYDETWVEYRKASERMKREQRLYVNACGPYADTADEEERFKAFVMAIEQVIAEEQQIYFTSTAAPKEGEQKKVP